MSRTLIQQSTDAFIRTVSDWPDEFARRSRSLLLRMCDASSLDAGELAELAKYGIWGVGAGRLTSVGEYLVDLVMHERWQEDDEVASFLQRGAERLTGDVLDVGCSSGWTLRNMRQPMPHARVGIDIDDRALALGRRLAKCDEQNITFANASVHNLPYPSESFDWVICRNALTYTHQRTAIGEMTRVLRPGGFLFLRFENYRYDLDIIAHARGVKVALCRIRDFAYGVTHALFARQPTPGSLLRGGRAMGSVIRITKYLRGRDLEIVLTAPSRRSPLILGKPNQTSMLAQKLGTLAVTPRRDTLAHNGIPQLAQRESQELVAG